VTDAERVATTVAHIGALLRDKIARAGFEVDGAASIKLPQSESGVVEASVSVVGSQSDVILEATVTIWTYADQNGIMHGDTVAVRVADKGDDSIKAKSSTNLTKGSALGDIPQYTLDDDDFKTAVREALTKLNKKR
jgi:hypothetical protein